MHTLLILTLVVVAAGSALCEKVEKTRRKYVWDLLEAPLDAAQLRILNMTNRQLNRYPTYTTIPHTNFNCSTKKQAGFYADMETSCQVYHRCDRYGGTTDYLCSSSTIFNQITLVCDSWYHVNCDRSLEFENFANERLYTDAPLFDTPEPVVGDYGPQMVHDGASPVFSSFSSLTDSTKRKPVKKSKTESKAIQNSEQPKLLKSI